jgi:hypothetical protein
MPVSRSAELLRWLGVPEGAGDAELANRVAMLAGLPAPRQASGRELLTMFVDAVSEVLANERYQTAVDTALFADASTGVLTRTASRDLWQAANDDLAPDQRDVSPKLLGLATRIAVRAHDDGLIHLEGQFRHPHTAWREA